MSAHRYHMSCYDNRFSPRTGERRHGRRNNETHRPSYSCSCTTFGSSEDFNESAKEWRATRHCATRSDGEPFRANAAKGRHIEAVLCGSAGTGEVDRGGADPERCFHATNVGRQPRALCPITKGRYSAGQGAFALFLDQ